METSFVTIFVAVLASIPGILAFAAQHKKNKADAADVIADTAMSLINPLKAEIADMQKKMEELGIRVEELEEENKILRDWAKNLATQVIQLGGTPCPEPILPKKRHKEKQQ